jgi:hypothetical protein
MVAPAQRDGKLVAHLTAECAVLRKAQVMGHPRVGDRKSDRTVGGRSIDRNAVFALFARPTGNSQDSVL